MTEFDTQQIPGITPKQWERLRGLLDGERFKVLELAWLRSATGMHSDCAWALMQALVRAGSARLTWLVYHECAEHPAAELPVPENLIPWLICRSGPRVQLPWECPECEEEVTDGSELRYEPRCVLAESVIFV